MGVSTSTVNNILSSQKEDGSGSSQGYIFGIVDSDVVLILSKH